MTKELTIPDAIRKLPLSERAAAISHWVYVETAKRIGRELHVPVSWSELDSDLRQFNLAMVETWAQPGVLELWIESIRANRD